MVKSYDLPSKLLFKISKNASYAYAIYTKTLENLSNIKNHLNSNLTTKFQFLTAKQFTTKVQILWVYE